MKFVPKHLWHILVNFDMSADASAAKEEPELRNRKTGETVAATDAKAAAKDTKGDSGVVDKKTEGPDLKKYMPKECLHLHDCPSFLSLLSMSRIQKYTEN